MTTTSVEQAALSARGAIRSPALRRIAVATSGASNCDGALRTAHALATRHDAHVSVVSVFHPRVPYPGRPAGAEHAAIPESDRHPARQQLSAVRRQLASLGAASEQWSLSFAAGNVAVNVNELAKSDHADLVIIGLGRVDPGERKLGDRGSMAIAAAVQRPLLAVAPDFAGQPRHILVAVGSDDSAVRALRLAQELFSAPDRLSLVHVVERIDREPAIRNRFDATRQALSAWSHVRVETRTLEGDPIDSLLDFAREQDADLVAGGLHGRTFEDRAITRNVVLWLMGIGNRSVLLVPFWPGCDDRPVSHLRGVTRAD